MKIKNFEQLAVTEGRRALLEIAEAGLQAIDTTNAVRELVRLEGAVLRVATETIDLKATGKIVVVAVGKCAAESASVFEEVLGAHIARGVAVDVKAFPELPHFKTFSGTHPLPSEENLKASEAIMEALSGLAENDLVIFAISGGGSTLLYLPENRENRDEARIVSTLMASGATIQEMNIVRKHLSLARGGGLAKAAFPARGVSLIMSDVPTNDLTFIASGPTVRDETSALDAENVLAKYDILKKSGVAACLFLETPKDEKYFARITNVLAISNLRALEAMKAASEKLGWRAEVRGSELIGEAKDVAKRIADELHAASPRSVLLWGGETTVTVRGAGRGGRNLELAASALAEVREGEEILSLASDGRDHGPFAGAICDTITKTGIQNAGLNVELFLKESNVYALFESAGHYLETGDTGSNVSDLMIALKA